jgi:hypothetical protein
MFQAGTYAGFTFTFSTVDFHEEATDSTTHDASDTHNATLVVRETFTLGHTSPGDDSHGGADSNQAVSATTTGVSVTTVTSQTTSISSAQSNVSSTLDYQGTYANGSYNLHHLTGEAEGSQVSSYNEQGSETVSGSGSSLESATAGSGSTGTFGAATEGGTASTHPACSPTTASACPASCCTASPPRRTRPARPAATTSTARP